MLAYISLFPLFQQMAKLPAMMLMDPNLLKIRYKVTIW